MWYFQFFSRLHLLRGIWWRKAMWQLYQLVKISHKSYIISNWIPFSVNKVKNHSQCTCSTQYFEGRKFCICESWYLQNFTYWPWARVNTCKYIFSSLCCCQGACTWRIMKKQCYYHPLFYINLPKSDTKITPKNCVEL